VHSAPVGGGPQLVEDGRGGWMRRAWIVLHECLDDKWRGVGGGGGIRILFRTVCGCFIFVSCRFKGGTIKETYFFLLVSLFAFLWTVYVQYSTYVQYVHISIVQLSIYLVDTRSFFLSVCHSFFLSNLTL
jgi:hypothetical protein